MIEFFKNQNVYVEQNPEFIIIFFFIIGLLLFFSKKIFQKLITGVKDFSDQSLQKYLFPYTPNLAEYYEKGFFTLWWTILFYNLIGQFTVRLPTYLQLLEITDWVIMARLVSIIFSLIIALIPSLMMTALADLNELISALHFYLCTTYRTYLRIILKIFVIRAYSQKTKIKAFFSFMFLFSLFIGYLLTGSPLCLITLLTIIYLGIYCDKIISEVFPGEQIIENITGLNYVITPETFLYYFRFYYWQNKLPYFYDEDAYEHGYHFGAISYRVFLLHIKMYIDEVEHNERLLKHTKDPRYQYASVLTILKSDNTFDNKKQETFKQLLVNLEREILKEHPDLKNTIKKSKEELFEKYPHWRKDLS